ncbi:XRE family transcriptional regulator [Streptomyces sp. LX-29]|uniref:helix-turn-helix domain-containing protein n=1 Tax=Streptomyces sp. LX-29 TaxID=2900152 RepID=UPI00240DCBDB|nr:XRE family transcriptional regulator [Streptomyces sp. LX-29]WFB08952.1 XRE family transcriptional regulator [Streptomyces sp. LX-29]
MSRGTRTAGGDPAARAPECVRLAEGLRELRSRTGLSLAALAARTAYSKSSWERYLNAKKLPPRQAVEALCALADEPAGRMVALWELAEAEWSGRAQSAPAAGGGDGTPPPRGDAPDPPPGPSPEGRRRSRRRWAAVLAALCALAAVVVLAVAAPFGEGSAAGAGARHPAHGTSPPPAGCSGAGCAGKDPEAMACGTQERVRTLGPTRRTPTGARMEIRYSAECRAAWGRIWNARPGDAVGVSAPGRPAQWATVRDDYDAAGYLYTLMVGVEERPRGLSVCFRPKGAKATDGADDMCFGP